MFLYAMSFVSDINECALDISNCDGDCTDNDGGYTCTCLLPKVLYTVDGTSGLDLPAGETGLLSTDVYHINHTCVCKYMYCENIAAWGDSIIHG